MSYEYDEPILSDLEQEAIQQRIDERERLERLEKCVGSIQDLIENVPKKKTELIDLVYEIKYIINSLD